MNILRTIIGCLLALLIVLEFPNNDILSQLKYHNPDLLFFSGDQIYEDGGRFGAQRTPVDKATLDYLRK